MDLSKYNQAKQTWQEIAKYAPEADLPYSFQLEIYKKLLARFHLDAYYYYIFNVGNVEMEFVSESLSTILGWSIDNFSTEYLVTNIHPEDQSRFIMYEQEVTAFFSKLTPDQVLKYKVSYDYRLRCADGSYKWILQQISTIQTNEDGAVVRVLGVHTDISHLKTEDKGINLSFIGLEDQPSYYSALTPSGKRNTNPPSLFTAREKEIIQLALLGKTTPEIASSLYISQHTVSVHRKNILRKSNCKSFVELGSKALREGWI
ncbi:LuxR C-terminal-related transcriptional regulator [Sphingobacterium faecale]|uniref:PAS domain-containing protein n=1 Tax=Sphingobacterium faecale TaxID=2803775 RepID=A0ABS1QZH4_9SPHI|nr:LuxR C-terminal-related transcriptional regulator [Sphingobacterium faecale]MBL1407825.1 PAS domain-containing protein [Sphingobacterium faecale]